MKQRKKKLKKCEICPRYFVPVNANQKRCRSTIPSERSECEMEARRRYTRKYRKDYKEKTGVCYQVQLKAKHKKQQEVELAALQPHKDLKKRVCLGPSCLGEKTFMSKGPFNRVCERCALAEEHVGGRYVTHNGHSPLSSRHAV